MIEKGTYDSENERSSKRYIDKKFYDEKGKEVKKKKAELALDKIAEDEKYDGYYALSTNIFKEEMESSKLVNISSRRWEIEECFRIMKTDLEARPFFHSKDSRIIAHFQTCFMALLLLRGVERKISDYYKGKRPYPDAMYTMNEILYALRNMHHIKEVRSILQTGGICGKRLDFMMQEFNREANTLASKASSLDITKVAVELKVLIEQMREQVQNIE